MGARPACQTCGTEFSPGLSPEGLCPACLLTQALAAPDEGDTSNEAGPSGLAPGAMFGPFRIEAVLGKGGMSTVYRADEPALDRVVALKILPPEFLHEDTFAKRFQQEARVVAALEHPHIVPLYASGIEGGIPWMSMRLLAGNVRALLDGHPIETGRAVEILRAIASALDYAHERGVIHRDVKPSNILLDPAGHVCVGDFGLAQLMERSLVHTPTGLIAGTPHYMAPEQALGQQTDHRVDIYSLGVVAYEMLTGQPPYDANSPVALMMKHAADPLPVPARGLVPEAVIPVLHKALAKQPAARWATAAELVGALEEALAARAGARSLRREAMLAAALGAAAIAAYVVLTPPASMPVQTGPLRAIGTEASQTSTASPLDAARPSTSAVTSGAPIEAPRPPAEETRPTLSGEGFRPGSARTVAGASIDPGMTPRQAGPEPAADAPAALSPSATVQIDAVEVGPTASPLADAPGPEAAPISRTTTGTSVEATNPYATSGDETRVIQPEPIQTVKPTYPPLALAAEIEGDVVLRAVVGPTGSVAEVQVVRSAHRLLDEAARDAVRRYRYKPGRRGGMPDTFDVQVTVSFRIQ